MSEFVIDEMLLGCLSRCTERIGKAIVGALNNDAKRSKTSRTSDNVHKHRLRAHTEKKVKSRSPLCAVKPWCYLSSPTLLSWSSYIPTVCMTKPVIPNNRCHSYCFIRYIVLMNDSCNYSKF